MGGSKPSVMPRRNRQQGCAVDAVDDGNPVRNFEAGAFGTLAFSLIGICSTDGTFAVPRGLSSGNAGFEWDIQ